LDEGTSRAKKELLANRCLDLPNIALDLEVAHDAPGRDRYRDAGAVRRARHFGIAHLLEPFVVAKTRNRLVDPSPRHRLVQRETAPAEKRVRGDPVAAGEFGRCEGRQLLHARFREILGDESAAPASTGAAFEGGKDDEKEGDEEDIDPPREKRASTRGERRARREPGAEPRLRCG